jgi:hypothetical protein
MKTFGYRYNFDDVRELMNKLSMLPQFQGRLFRKELGLVIKSEFSEKGFAIWHDLHIADNDYCLDRIRGEYRQLDPWNRGDRLPTLAQLVAIAQEAGWSGRIRTGSGF